MKKEIPASVDAYIASFPEEIQQRLQQIRNTIRKAAPKAEECISYQMPAYKQDGVLMDGEDGSDAAPMEDALASGGDVQPSAGASMICTPRWRYWNAACPRAPAMPARSSRPPPRDAADRCPAP